MKLIQAIDQNRDHDWIIYEGEYDFQKMTNMNRQFRDGVVVEYINRYPNAIKGFYELNRILEELENCQKNPFPITFCVEMSKFYPDYVKIICDEIIKYPSLSIARCFSYFLCGLLEKDQKTSGDLLQKAIGIDEEKLLNSVADYYWRGLWIEYFDASIDLSIIRKLLDSKYEFAKLLVIGGVGKLGKSKPDVTKELLLAVDIGNQKNLATEYYQQFDTKYTFDPDLLTDKELDVVLNKLEKINDIDDYHIEEFINYAGSRLPLIVIRFLLGRIELSKKDGNYKPISYSSRTFLHGFSTSPLYADVLREVRNKILDNDWQNRFGLQNCINPYRRTLTRLEY